jgi:hypothetical protein
MGTVYLYLYLYYRAVVVAGGTMQPLDEFRDQLFLSAGGTAERLTEFSCGHVIPPENILPIALTAGPSGKQLDFAYQSRTLPVMVSLRVVLKYVKCSQSIFMFLICCAKYVYLFNSLLVLNILGIIVWE